MANTRVDHAVEHVYQQVNQNDHAGDQQYPALHHRVVAALQRIDQPAAQSRPEKMVSVRMAPASMVPTCSPITVTTGSSALRSA